MSAVYRDVSGTLHRDRSSASASASASVNNWIWRRCDYFGAEEMGRKCAISGCRSNIKKAKTPGEISLFLAPKNADLFQKWKEAITLPNFELTQNSRLCHLHFKEEDINKYFITKLSNGEISKIPRDRIHLNAGAVPSIFDDIEVFDEKRKHPKSNIVQVENVIYNSHERETNMPEDRNSYETVINDTDNTFNIPVMDSTNDELIFTFQDIHDNMASIQKPNDLWGQVKTQDFVIFSRWTKDFACIKKVIIESSLKIILHEREVNIADSNKVTSLHDIATLLNRIEYIRICLGAPEKSMTNCSVVIFASNKPGRLKSWCPNCLSAKRSGKRKSKRTLLGFQTLQNRMKNIRDKHLRLKHKLKRLEQEIIMCQDKMSTVAKEVIEEEIESLPLPQQEAIKGKKSYDHLRKHKILSLPSTQTLHKYIEKVKGVYGFQSSVFNILAKKSENMDVKDRRGVLLLDEMKISSRLNFNRRTLQFEGLVNLGDETPEKQKDVKADHVLVFMFQPFRGTWVQSLACFLSKSAATGKILHRLVMECVILLEKAGFFVDAATSDAASWNRNMWKQFGVNANKPSCPHVCDPQRRLWFISDFPHLIKNLRNTITDRGTLKTPDGLVSKDFWAEVVAADSPSTHALKRCPKLKHRHINPTFYEKMSVRMAFEFFSHDVASAMRILRDGNVKLKDSEGCETFIERIHKLITIMTARVPKEALRPNSESLKTLKEFLNYLSNWESMSKSHPEDIDFLTESTATGLKVTIASTLELFQFLTEEQGFCYLLTAKLSQDNLERFFGMMRDACGSDDHPDATTFIQVFRLMSTYNLVKPPRGSNVTGSDLVRSILEFDDLTPSDNASQEFCNRLRLLLTTVSEATKVSNSNDHSYFQQNSPESVVGYMAGYVAFRYQTKSKCSICKEELLLTDEDKENISMEAYSLIKSKSYGYLKEPSLALIGLISSVEKSILKVLSAQKIQMDTLMLVMDDLEQVNFPLVGCEQHQHSLTKSILQYYLIMRMFFICKQENVIDSLKTEKSRKYKKLAKI